MTTNKNELILNPEYYSADLSMEEEPTKSIYLRVLIQLSIVSVIFTTLIFSYKYVKHNYYEDIRLWIIEGTASTNVMKKERVPIIIREEEIKVLVQPKVEPQIVQYEEVTDEYLKLVQDSLGKY